jgi:hypothetical protein
VRDHRNAFHLAIPSFDLSEAEHFYVDLLGAKLARRYADRITLDFFVDQLVCHLVCPAATQTAMAGDLELYPRHFGITFVAEEEFLALYELVSLRKVPVFSDMKTRFEGLAEVHQSLVLVDPSDNLIEFKHYKDPRMMY